MIGAGVIQSHLKQSAGAPGKYKASLCKFFQQGTCTKGAQCTWSHGEDGGGMGMMDPIANYKKSPCKFFMSGQCQNGDACTFSHGENGEAMMAMGMGAYGGMGGMGGYGKGGKGMAMMAPVANYKKTPCKFFMLGQCQKGGECTYSHGETGEAMTAMPTMAAMAAMAYGMGGGMDYGKGGGMGGSMFGKTPCKFFAAGMCAKGDACTFSHGAGGKGMMGMMGMMGGKGMMGWDNWGMDFGKGKGKDKGKGKGKGPKGKGHLLPRTRISEAPFLGTVLEWKGKYGWIQPSETIEHPKAMKHEGKLFIGLDDCPEGSLTVGSTVSFHIWEDPSGLGADEVAIQ